MTHEQLFAEMKATSDALNKGADTYDGGPKPFHHMGLLREAAFPWLSDIEMAGHVRMLTRNDLMHESIVCAARDRILHLSEENKRLRDALAQIGELDGLGLGDCLDIACVALR